MSYLTGTVSNFESRLHALPTTSGDLVSFAIEYSSISGKFSIEQNNRIDKEIVKIQEIHTPPKTTKAISIFANH